MSGVNLQRIVGMCGSLVCVGWAGAQWSPEPDWVLQFGSAGGEILRSMCPDGEGGLYLAGETFGTWGGPYLGGGDVFLSRHDSAGNIIWIRQFGTTTREWGYAVASDDRGGAIIGGVGVSIDAFLALYDPSGSQVWLRGVEGDIRALVPDGGGGVIAAGGIFAGPEVGTDVWLARFDASGERTWMDSLSSKGNERAHALAPDGAGGFFVAGITHGDLGGPRAGGTDAFVAKYDSADNLLWLTQFGSSSGDEADAVVADGAGGAYVAGYTFGDLGGPPAGGADAWLARYNANGEQMWAAKVARHSNDRILALATDDEEGVLAGGSLTSRSGRIVNDDAFVARFGPDGKRQWLAEFGTPEDDWASALLADAASPAVYVAGVIESDHGRPGLVGDAFLARFPTVPEPCDVDCDGSGVLDFFDFLCFQTAFAAGDPLADCDGSGALDFRDFLCYQAKFAAGCP